jgi:hypothetical protein
VHFRAARDGRHDPAHPQGGRSPRPS